MLNTEGFLTKKKDILRFFQNFDNFGVQMQLRINNSDKYRSKCGGLVFSFYFLISLGYILYNFYNFAWRKNMTLIYSSKIVEQENDVNLAENSFVISIGLMYQENNSFVDNYLLNFFDFSYAYTVTNSTGKFKQSFQLRPCEHSDFGENVFYDFEKFNLNKTFCPDLKDFNQLLSGRFGDPVSKYSSLSISINKDYMNDLQAYGRMLEESYLKAVIFFVETGVDYESFTNPTPVLITPYIVYLDLATYKKTDINLAFMQFRSDSNFLFNDPIKYDDIVVESFRDYIFAIEDRKNSVFTDALNLVRFYIKASNKIIVYERTYQKLSDFLANMGGMVSQVGLIIYVIMTNINEASAHQKIVNKIMRFRGKKNQDIDLLLSMVKHNDSLINMTNNISNVYSPFSKRSQRTVDQFFKGGGVSGSLTIESPGRESISSSKVKRVSFFPDKVVIVSTPTNGQNAQLNNNQQTNFSNLNLKKTQTQTSVSSTPKYYNASYGRPFKMSAWEIFMSNFCFWNKKLKFGTHLINKSKQKINYYMDILTYIKKMQEIDLLKFILLNPEQLQIFNFLSTPAVIINDNRTDVFKQLQEEINNKDCLDKLQVEKIYNSYSSMVSQGKHKSIDKKLIQLFNNELDNFK
jgi:hypothetical protein